jgi:hypothetical protein
MKKLFILCLLTVSLCSFETLIRSSQPPQGHTGASGSYCTNCHATNPLNNPGGSVQVTGLPDGNYTAGTAYNFSININHSAADRKRWGFSIEARNSANQAVGTFSTTNTNAANNGLELSHFNAQNFAAATSSYTYNNLTWTAPANPGPNDANITFYFVGNAANGNGFNSGDFIYSNTKSISLLANLTYTFTGSGNWSNPANWSNNTIPPATITGSATIIIDPIAEGECVLDVQQHISNNATLTVAEGKLFRIQGNLTVTN